ncbi:MAG: hypothetical protein ACQER4_08090 [Bacteroidota bacterium]
MNSNSSAARPTYSELLKRFTAPLLITLILLASHLSFGILDSVGHLMTAIVASFLTEALLHRFLFGKWRDLSSAYVSGISAGILIRSPLYWPFALCAMLSIASKYVFRYKDRHIWNPTNFGVVMILLFASDYAAVLSIQWGSQMWAMLVIWIVGLITVYRANRFHISAVYVLSFFFFGWIRSGLTGDPFLAEISAITGPMYQLFALFMITDPKTTVYSYQGRMWVAFLIAFVEFLFRLFEAVYAPFYALFLVGPVAMVVEDLWTSRIRSGSNGNSSVDQPD